MRGGFEEERRHTGYGVLTEEVNLEDGFGVGKFQALEICLYAQELASFTAVGYQKHLRIGLANISKSVLMDGCAATDSYLCLVSGSQVSQHSC